MSPSRLLLLLLLQAPLLLAAQLPDPSRAYAWYSADSGLGVEADDYSIAAWTNRGTAHPGQSAPASRHLVNLTGGPQKVHLLDAGSRKTAAVRFGGQDGIWATKANFGILGGDRTVVACVRLIGAGGQGFLFDSTSTTPGYLRALVVSNRWHISTTSMVGTPTAAAVTNAWQVHSFVLKSNAPSSRVTHFVDGAVAGSVDTTTAGALSGLMIGANVAQKYGIHADVAEFMVFPEALSDPERAGIEGALSNKWHSVVADPNPPAPRVIRLFAGGQDGYACYRIPALVTTTNGTIIAMADGRLSGCGDIPNPLDLVMKRSFDNGKTWTPLQVVVNYGSDPSDQDVYPAKGITSPIPRVSGGDAALLVDRQTGRVWVLYDNGGLSGGRKIKLELRFSDDDGANWSWPLDIETLYPGLRPAGNEFLAGPGNGIQLESGPHAGRLIFPVYIYGQSSSSLVIYSDDHGGTWRRGGVAGVGGGEIQVVETAGGGLLASMRDNNFSTSGVRTFSRSTDGGLTWSVPYTSTPQQPPLPDPECQASILRLTTTNDSNRSRLLFANAAHPSSRVAMTLRLSYDEGNTWPVSNLVYAGSSAYSAVTLLGNGDVGLLFETANYGRIDFVRRSISEITGGGDTPPRRVKLGLSPASESAWQLRFSASAEEPYSVEQRAGFQTAGWNPYTVVHSRTTNFTATVPIVATNQAGFFRVAVAGELR